MNKADMFKKILQVYLFCKKDLRRIDDELELRWYDLSNVKGIDPSKQPGSSNVQFMEQIKLEKYDQIDELMEDRMFYKTVIDYIDRKMDKLPEDIRSSCSDLYIKGKTYITVSAENYISDGGLFKRIENELKKNI